MSCKQIALYAEETKLYAITTDSMIPDDVFEEGIGYFWNILETRPYMRSRFALTEARCLLYALPLLSNALWTIS